MQREAAMRSIARRGWALLFSLALAGPVRAAEPPPPRPFPRLYVRSTLGFGVLVSSTNGDSLATAGGDHEQPSLSLDLLVGSALSARTTCGAALLFENGLPGRPIDDAAIPYRHVRTGLLGPFFDGYPVRGSGVHLGFALGASWIRFDSNLVVPDRVEALGLGTALWFGEDVELGSRWSVGPLVRVMAERARDRDDSYNRPWAQSLTLSVSAVYR